jgi:hypothetical protein
MVPRIRTALVAATLAAVVGSVASAQSVGVTLNGQIVNLSPAPETREGRVFVPLRGVFERLGASVVYANGTINAQGNGHSVQLHIGSNQAVVDGNGQQLDVAPFLIGDYTYVPLRFVSQALGATVNYDNGSRVVSLITNGNGAPQNAAQVAPQPQRPVGSPLVLRAVRPERNATADTRRPTIEAQFGNATADPNTIHVVVDGVDVTNESSRSPAGIVFSPPSDLQSMQHTVRVSGRDTNDRPFDRTWQFSSGNATVTNFINDLQPANNSEVSRQLAVTGHTLPNAKVVVQLGTIADRAQPNANDVIGQILGINTGGNRGGNAVRVETNADGNGAFSTQLSIGAQSGQHLGLVVDSTDPRTQASARVQRTLTVR